MPGLLIAISAAGAASVDVRFDTLRRWLVDGLVPVVVVAGQNMVRSIDVGISLQTAASELGAPVDSVVLLLQSGDLKPLPLPGATRLRKADIEAFARKLTPLPMTDELRESIWPSVDEFVGLATEPGILDGWADGMRHAAARDEAAVRKLREEFGATLPPASALLSNADGDQIFDPSGYRSPEETENLWQAFLARKRAREEQAEFDRLHSHNPRGY
jgi:hypothetical protein